MSRLIRAVRQTKIPALDYHFFAITIFTGFYTSTLPFMSGAYFLGLLAASGWFCFGLLNLLVTLIDGEVE